MRINKIVAVAAIAAVSQFVAPIAVFAQSNLLASQATGLIDVTAGQRMLSQRVVKSVCLATAQVNFAANFEEIRIAHSDFKIRHYALLNGSTQLGIPQISAPEVRVMLEQSGSVFQGFAPIVDHMTQTGDIDQIELVSLNDQSLFLVGALNDTIQELGTVYADTLSSQNLGLTLTLDIAARQTMLSQQLVKEMCLMHLLGNQAGNIRASMDLFDASLNALINGFPAAGVIAPPTAEIRDKLVEVNTIWGTLKPIAEKSANGNVPDRDSLYMFSLAMEAVLRTTSEATSLYTE
jgi:hypothetical protein